MFRGILGDDSEARKSPQEPVQRGGLRPAGCREFSDGSLAVAQGVCDTQTSCRAQDAAARVAHGHFSERLVLSDVADCAAACRHFRLAPLVCLKVYASYRRQGATSRMCVATNQRLPKGSVTPPLRSP